MSGCFAAQALRQFGLPLLLIRDLGLQPLQQQVLLNGRQRRDLAVFGLRRLHLVVDRLLLDAIGRGPRDRFVQPRDPLHGDALPVFQRCRIALFPISLQGELALLHRLVADRVTIWVRNEVASFVALVRRLAVWRI